MSSVILIQGVLDLVTVQNFTISFYLKEKNCSRRNMVVFIPLIMISFSEVEQWIPANNI